MIKRIDWLLVVVAVLNLSAGIIQLHTGHYFIALMNGITVVLMVIIIFRRTKV